MKTNNNPLLSIRLMTYNHASFIRDAMDGIMMQETNFLLEVVIGDDFSSDETLEIIREYKEKENIKINILERKVGDTYWKERQEKGRLYNFVNIIENCKGKYIALIDGDDCWIDPKKLQKQVDFLEENEDFNISFHLVDFVDSDQKNVKKTNLVPNETVFEFSDLIENNFIYTASSMIRKRSLPEKFPSWFFKMPIGDWSLYLLAAKGGKIKRIDEIMANYRIHEQGIYTTTNSLVKSFNWAKGMLLVQKHMPKKHSIEFKKRAAELIYQSLYKNIRFNYSYKRVEVLFYYIKTIPYRSFKHIFSPFKWLINF